MCKNQTGERTGRRLKPKFFKNMTLLDSAGIRFFKEELLKETNRQLMMFEENPPPDVAIREVGRIRLYDDRSKIQKHFFVCEPDCGAYESNHPQHGVIGKLEGNSASATLVWRELEGLRHSLKAEVENDLIWIEKKVPDARLTREGKFRKKRNYHEELA